MLRNAENFRISHFAQMLDSVAHFGFFYTVMQFAGFPGMVTTCKSLRFHISKFSVKWLVELASVKQLIRSDLFPANMQTHRDTIVATIPSWSCYDWNQVFIDQVLNGQHCPHFIQAFLSRKLYHLLRDKTLHLVVFSWLGIEFGRPYVSIVNVSDLISNILSKYF